ncbi:hypothetical protein GCM10023091_38330 [Ravibacter arvi]|uniref:Cytochrome c domain-containing protein n=1 Tax=Ravibacter arvi TaxID=2051041 RepID=A0ABP8M8I3_9BACT
MRLLAILIAGHFLVYACTRKQNPKDWPEYLGGPERSHFSALDQITKENIKDLEVAWVYNSGDSGVWQCNPIVIDGTLYSLTAASEAFALEAATGKEKWRFAPSEKKNFLKNRGVAFWQKDDDKRILFSYDEWLYALNAETGEVIRTFGEDGKVSLRTGLGENGKGKYLMSRTPGTIFEDLIIMPTVMMEEAGAAPGFLQAFHVKTGELAWVFHTIPRKGEFGADTWPEDVHTKGVVGAANNWTGMTVDYKRGMIYVPTGSAAPDFFGGSRKGQNLFANTLLALDARTGKRKWHYQIIRHDIWDMDLPSPPNLMTIRKDGREREVVVQQTKKGYIFVFDRDTGEPVFPVEEVKVPASPIAEEEAWPTQPIPKLPLPIARQEILESDLNIHSPDYDSLKKVYHSYRKGKYLPVGEVPTMVTPGLMGGAEWGGAAVDSDGMLYVNSNEVPWILTLRPTSEGEAQFSGGERVYRNTCSTCHGPDRLGNPASGFPSLVSVKEKLSHDDLANLISRGRGMMPGFPQLSASDKKALIGFLFGEKEEGSGEDPIHGQTSPADAWTFKGYTKFLDREGRPGILPPWGRFTAIDMNTGQQKWQVPLGEIPSYKARGIPNSGTENYGGPILTASGILFIAATEDAKFRAFDKENGALLWETDVPAPAFSTPSTFEVNGAQYVVLSCGGTTLGTKKGDALVAFKLKK